MNFLRLTLSLTLALMHVEAFALPAQSSHNQYNAYGKAQVQTTASVQLATAKDCAADCLLSMLPIPDPCGRFGKLFGAAYLARSAQRAHHLQRAKHPQQPATSRFNRQNSL